MFTMNYKDAFAEEITLFFFFFLSAKKKLCKNNACFYVYIDLQRTFERKIHLSLYLR